MVVTALALGILTLLHRQPPADQIRPSPPRSSTVPSSFLAPGFTGRVIMELVPSPADLEREWMAQWRRAGVALARVRADELAHLPAADALAATDALLAIGANVPRSIDSLGWSGLIELQRHLHRRR